MRSLREIVLMMYLYEDQALIAAGTGLASCRV